MKEVDWRGYVTKKKPLVGDHLKEVNRQAASATKPADGDDGGYSPSNKISSARVLTLETYCGTVIDYLDFMEKQIKLYLVHHNPVSSEHRSRMDEYCNIRPWSMTRDQVFLKNGTIKNFDKAQSEH